MEHGFFGLTVSFFQKGFYEIAEFQGSKSVVLNACEVLELVRGADF